LAVAAFVAVSAQDTVRVSGTTGTRTFFSDTVYVLEGYVRVDNGETLTIEAGTVVLADTGSLENASALIVERDGMIMAEGTAAEPIIFSSLLDDVNDPDDLLNNDARGLWGGIIVCGDASTNTANNGNEQVEGIPSTLPATVGTFGGTEDNDISGVIRYVSIRHTGVALASNNEIQGLTLAGVGNGTTIEYVESYASDDDGIEIFGGTVDLKYVAIVFAADDMLDLDQGYRGRMQHVFIVQNAAFGDRTGELDGADTPQDGTPFSAWQLYNATIIGNRPAGTNNRLATFRANGAGQIWNSVMIEQGRGVDIEIVPEATVTTNSYERFQQGTLALAGNVFWNVGDNAPEGIFNVNATAGPWVDSAATVAAAEVDFEASFMANGNMVSNPRISSLSYTNDGGLDPRFFGPAITANTPKPTDPFYDVVSYKGAFGPKESDLWIKGWTALDHYGYLPTFDGVTDTITVSGTTGDATWTNDNVYTLEGSVRVDNGDSLFIQAGTVVLADTGAQEAASALIVERDGYLEALGTAECPVIFSSVLDDVNDPEDLLDKQARGLWGGIIMCGDASTNTANNGNEQVEGIPSTLPMSVGTFGGNEDNDNSGILRYVSIRHTGVALASNNEIQGLTLAGVGDGTTIDYVESYASDDDGIEIFGGTVNMTNISIAFAADDMLDLDQGYRGKIQNLFIIQAASFGDRIGEWDGADTPGDGTPFSGWVVYNATMIGNRPAGTNNRMITYRANGAGQVWNSIMIEQGRGVDVEIVPEALVSTNSFERFEDGSLALANNIFFGVGDSTPEGIFNVNPVAGAWMDSAATVSAAEAAFEASFAANNNVIVDPKISSLSYTDDGGLDPRFAGFEVTQNVATPTDPFFTALDYKGAFGRGVNDVWIKGWTALDHYGYLGTIDSEVTALEPLAPTGATVQYFPNPTTGILNIEADNLNTKDVTIRVFDLQGRMVASKTANAVAGSLATQIDLSAQQKGMYIISVENNGKADVSRIILK